MTYCSYSRSRKHLVSRVTCGNEFVLLQTTQAFQWNMTWSDMKYLSFCHLGGEKKASQDVATSLPHAPTHSDVSLRLRYVTNIPAVLLLTITTHHPTCALQEGVTWLMKDKFASEHVSACVNITATQIKKRTKSFQTRCSTVTLSVFTHTNLYLLEL